MEEDTMEITFYNTCPVEYEKKFIQILKQVIRPAQKEGKAVLVWETKEEKRHSQYCHEINDKRARQDTKRKRRECSGCIKNINTLIVRESDLTMKIRIF